MKDCDHAAWARLRHKYTTRLLHEASRGLVDPDILDVVYSVNRIGCYVTVSSCSGRIALFSAPSPGDKRRGGIVAKWHRRVTIDELAQALAAAEGEYVWVSSQPVILALYSCGEDSAARFVDAMLRAGLKYSFYRRSKIGRGIYYTVTYGTERVDIPLRVRGETLIGPSGLPGVVKTLNAYLTLAKEKLYNLKRAVAVIQQGCTAGDEEAIL